MVFRMHKSLLSLLAGSCVTLIAVVGPDAFARQQATPDNIGHSRHKHHHNEKHPVEAPTPARFVTSRKSDIVLPLPQEKDAFSFVVFGDRTGGPVEGVKVLADAVRDTNLFEPDLVMTVGDLINGYNEAPAWMEQVKEYRQIMDELRCPWFPVAGNHDTYWRGKGDKPKGEHDGNYEMHFGPLWYAFEHKNCWFIALYSDETNPDTGEKDFRKPENHRMSEEQFSWLSETLGKAKGADHVFLFLHHPRWIGGNYGNQWDRVHELLRKAGNVTAVFAGHIHRMRYDPRDGIEYVTLATVGGGQSGLVPEAGWLHHYHVITVRKQQVAMAAVPVGEVLDVREITGEFAAECERQAARKPDFDAPLVLESSGLVSGRVKLTVANVTTREVDLTIAPDSADSRWSFSPDHDHARVKPGESATLEFVVERPAGSLDDAFMPLEVVVNADVLMPGHRYSLPEKRFEVPLDESRLASMPAAGREQVLLLDGDDAVVIADADLPLPDGPLTLEAWFRGDDFKGRTGLVCKTQASDYGIFVSDGRLEFSVFLGQAYAAAKSGTPVLEAGRWHHAAGVFDGSEVRLYLDGRLIDKVAASGKRKTKPLPLVIGADVDGPERPVMSHFRGMIDGVRLSSTARYAGESFAPERRCLMDPSTVLLANMDSRVGRRLRVEGTRNPTAAIQGKPMLVEAP